MRIIARTVKRCPQCPWHVEIDDLVSEGRLALVRVASRYTSDRGKFATYAEPRVRGQMLDYLRRCGWPNRYYKAEAIAEGRPIVRMVRLTKAIERDYAARREKTAGCDPWANS